MTLPTTQVQCNLFDQIGEPAINALVHLRLTDTDIDSAHGIVIPETIQVQADASGYFEVGVWPNERGQRNTQYKVWVLEGEGCAHPIWDVLATVPEAGPANLRDLIDTPPPSSTKYLKEVSTDSTLEGDGTQSSPLSVLSSPVLTDAQYIEGDGTSESPLTAPDMLRASQRLSEFATQAEKIEARDNLGLNVIDGGSFV